MGSGTVSLAGRYISVEPELFVSGENFGNGGGFFSQTTKSRFRCDFIFFFLLLFAPEYLNPEGK